MLVAPLLPTAQTPRQRFTMSEEAPKNEIAPDSIETGATALLFSELRELVVSARECVATAANSEMTLLLTDEQIVATASSQLSCFEEATYDPARFASLSTAVFPERYQGLKVFTE